MLLPRHPFCLYVVAGSFTVGILSMKYSVQLARVGAALMLFAASAVGQLTRSPLTKPRPRSEPRPSASTVLAWQSRRFGMFIHFGLYSELGGVWQGKPVQNGYSEQIMANAPIPRDQYAELASTFDPEKFDPDAIVALAKAAGMRYIVITAKHHDGFAMFTTKQSDFNIVQASPYHRDVVKELADACARGGLKFGVYYSTIDWHAPTGSPYIEGNSNPISDAHAAFNAAQLKELMTGYGPLSEVWFDMGKPTPEQSKLFAETVHRLQAQTMVSGRVFNYEGDFTVMGDNEVPQFAIDEPWQTPASIFSDTWGYRSWQRSEDLQAKVQEKVTELVTVVSRGGNYILNIGPMGDGSVVPFEADVLRGVGDWLHREGEAVFGSGEGLLGPCPFKTLTFGYATVAPTKLYLFLKSVPKDGRLRLPGVQEGTTFGSPYLLHAPEVHAGTVERVKGGLEVRLTPTLQEETLPPMSVVVVPFSGELRVRPENTLFPDASGTMTLTPESADTFLNYNGGGYDDPGTRYKLRWHLVPKRGMYRVTLHYAEAADEGDLDLVSATHIVLVNTRRGTQDGVWTGLMSLKGGDQELVITPREPFLKGTKLPVAIHEVTLRPVPVHHTRGRPARLLP